MLVTGQSREEAMELGSSFGAVVVGTGLGESVVAAGATRADLSVLHLDPEPHYGGLHASFNLRAFTDFLTSASQPQPPPALPPDLQLPDDLRFVPLQALPRLHDVTVNWHVQPPPEAKDDQEKEEDEAKAKDEEKNEPEGEAVPEDERRRREGRGLAEREWRRFSVDVWPKLAPARGPLVELMVRCGVHRYAEFVLCDRLLAHFDGRLRSVPISRADVFRDTQLSMLDKRKLTGFLKGLVLEEPSAADSPAEEPAAEEESFRDYLAGSGLSALLQRLIHDSIAMASPGTRKSAGLASVRAFLASAGRFGNSPWLWSLYGSGEVPQFFCRLAAVHGATYALDVPVHGLLLHKEQNKVAGVAVNGQTVLSDHVVCEAARLPAPFALGGTRLRRAVLITDSSLLAPNEEKASGEHSPSKAKSPVSVLHWVGEDRGVRCLELPHASMCAPKGLYLVQLSESYSEGLAAGLGPEDFFRPFVEEVVGGEGGAGLLWSASFSVESGGGLAEGAPEGLAAVGSPSGALDCADVVAEAEAIFRRLWPAKDFLPPLKPQDDEDEDGLGLEPDTADEAEPVPEPSADGAQQTQAHTDQPSAVPTQPQEQGGSDQPPVDP